MNLRYCLLGLALAAMTTAARADDAKPTADLAAVPDGAVGCVHVRVAELWKSDAPKDLRRIVEKAGADVLKAFDQRFVPAPSSIDRITVIVMMPEGGRGEPPVVAVVATADPFEKAALIKHGLPGAKEEKAGDARFHLDAKTNMAVQVIDDRTFAFGPIDAVRHFAAQKRGSGEFARAVKVLGNRQVVAVVNSGLLPAEAVGELPPPLQPLARAKTVQIGLGIDKDVTVDVRLRYADADAAKAGEDAARGGLAMAREELAKLRKELEEKLMPKGGPAKSPLAELPEAAVALVAVGSLKQADEILADLPLKRDGEMLATSATAPAGPLTSALSVSSFSAALLLPAVQKVRMAAARSQSQNNLKQMALAMHNHEAAFNRLPPAAICDKNGKPLLSWRVAILPFIEQDNLYKQFHLDEPWDSEHNKKLIAQMPRIYAIAGVNDPGDTTTHYRVFHGNGALFDLKKGLRFTDITDGTSNTIMIVEAAESVPWTKPDDLEFDPAKPLPKLGRQSADGFHIAMADGSVRFVSHGVKVETLKALITRAGGEVIGPDF